MFLSVEMDNLEVKGVHIGVDSILHHHIHQGSTIHQLSHIIKGASLVSTVHKGAPCFHRDTIRGVTKLTHAARWGAHIALGIFLKIFKISVLLPLVPNIDHVFKTVDKV